MNVRGYLSQRFRFNPMMHMQKYCIIGVKIKGWSTNRTVFIPQGIENKL